LAVLYAQGKVVAQSFKKAAELYALAANQGHARAQYNLGVAYDTGKGVAQSYEKAFELYTLAANQGYAVAQFNLGGLYYHGHGVAQSNAMARKWWLKAALQEHEKAINNLKILDQKEGKTTPTLACCATCGTPKTTKRPLNICTRCRTVRYCNRECQMTHWKEGGHKRECRRLKAAAEAEAAKQKASLPKKNKDDDSNKEKDPGDKDGLNDANEMTTTSTTTATTTTTTTTADVAVAAAAGSSPVCPEEEEDEVGKESVTAPATTSLPPPRTYVENLTCCVCMDDLQVDCNTFSRMTCCGHDPNFATTKNEYR
jgi:hypothetical protein